MTSLKPLVGSAALAFAAGLASITPGPAHAVAAVSLVIVDM